jgi:hypothetical protein
VERREHRYRGVWPQELRQRLFLAQTENINFILSRRIDETTCQFVIEGTTQRIYNVYIRRRPTCTCRDFAERQDLCKHIIFVNRYVIGLEARDPRCFQRAYLASELRAMMEMMESGPSMMLLL